MSWFLFVLQTNFEINFGFPEFQDCQMYPDILVCQEWYPAIDIPL